MSNTTQKSRSTMQTRMPAGDGGSGIEVDAATKRLVEKTVVRLNGLVREAGGRYEQIADHLLATVFDGDVDRALNLRNAPPMAFTLLAVHAGRTLDMSRTALSAAVRIGALNKRQTHPKWANLSWSIKVELLPLLGADNDFDRLAEGVRFAGGQNVSVRDVRDWVAGKAVGEPDKKVEAPRAAGFTAGRAAIQVGASLAKAVDRRRIVERASHLPDDARKALMTDLRSAIRNLEKLAGELAALEE